MEKNIFTLEQQQRIATAIVDTYDPFDLDILFSDTTTTDRGSPREQIKDLISNMHEELLINANEGIKEMERDEINELAYLSRNLRTLVHRIGSKDLLRVAREYREAKYNAQLQ